MMDSNGMDKTPASTVRVHYEVNNSYVFVVDDLTATPSRTVSDTAHITGLTESSLRQKSKKDTITSKHDLNNSKLLKRGKTSTTRTKVLTTVELSSTNVSTRKISSIDPNHLQNFMRGASVAQKAQIGMIQDVFSKMDVDGDGLLSMNDVRQYFRAIGKFASDLEVRKWISCRDIDQDGTVSLSEFIASFSLQLDPRTVADRSTLKGASTLQMGGVSELTEAFGLVRLGNSVPEAVMACEAAEGYTRRILDAPSNQAFWSIAVNDESFRQRIGKLFGGSKLMTALGFHFEQNGAVLTVANSDGKGSDALSPENRKSLSNKLRELQNHRTSLQELTISNIAAGKSLFFPLRYMDISDRN